MLRDPNLVPLSRQHHHALALCVRIRRALSGAKADLGALQSEIEATFAAEIEFHFRAEEEMLFPYARKFPELRPVVEDLLRDHAALRRFRAEAAHRLMSAGTLEEFAETLSAHIRKEEGELFEGLQKALPAREMAEAGRSMSDFFHSVALGATCLAPPPAEEPEDGIHGASKT